MSAAPASAIAAAAAFGSGPPQRPRGAFPMLGVPDDDILVWLRRAYAALGPDGFTVNGYARWRREEMERTGERIPSCDQLKRRYKSFTEAVHKAMPDLPRRGLRLAAPKRGGQPSSGIAGDGDAESPAESGLDPAETDGRLELIDGMLATLSVEALRELERALRRRIAPSTGAAKRRIEMLGFLAELLAAEAIDANGRRFVMREEYESKRPPTAASAERLQIAFGSWRAACRAADGHLADGRRFLPGPTGPRGKQTGVRYTREDVLQAVRLCAKEIGRTPSSGDYHHWELERRARLRVHGERPRLPGYKTVCRLFRADGRRARTSIWTAVLKALAA